MEQNKHPYTCAYCTGDGESRPSWATEIDYAYHMAAVHDGWPNEPADAVERVALLEYREGKKAVAAVQARLDEAEKLLDKIEAWSRPWKGQPKSGIRRSLQIIHEETRALLDHIRETR